MGASLSPGVYIFHPTFFHASLSLAITQYHARILGWEKIFH